jgi:putative toxin-antitoxin system antitoxin component (TIGR02293 family)
MSVGLKEATKPALRPIAKKRKVAGLQKPARSLVESCLHRLPGQVGKGTADAIKSIEAGLRFDELDTLRVSLGVPMQSLADKLGISKATLQRRKVQGRFDAAESDRLVRLARLVGLAIEVMETEDNARLWLSSSQAGLGGAIPLDYAKTEIGAREVEDLLGRIEYGVYS